MSTRARPFFLALWGGVIVQVAGQILDGIWHANHDEFEGTSQQLEAHWLLWLGVAITLVAAAVALARLPARDRNAGFVITLVGCLLYVPVSVWHFVEHANRSDPELAHILLALAQITIFTGGVVAAILVRRRPLTSP